jgi:GMP synthase-like glutamine amidotransferase
MLDNTNRMKEKKMRAHYLQHVPFEGLGSIKPWLLEKGFEITSTKFFKSDFLPDPHLIDLLIVMGGPMSADDQERYPWIDSEIRFIHDVIQLNQPVLGICLGAQLIAKAMGAKIYPNAEKEIGWFPVEGISPGDTAGFRFPQSMTAFHWHGETFDLPGGAVHLARSRGCEHQAFQIGTSVIGLQFHLETTRESSMALVTNCRDDLQKSKYVQTESDILAAAPETYHSINRWMGEVLSYLARTDG